MTTTFSWAFFGGKPEGIATLKAVSDAVGPAAFISPPRDLPDADIKDLEAAANSLGCDVIPAHEALSRAGALSVGLCQRFDIIKPEFVGAPRHGFMNLHPSLLPKYKGIHPISWALVNGEIQTGATLHVIDRDVDTGPIIFQEAFEITLEDDIWSVTEKCSRAATHLAVRAMEIVKKSDNLPPSIAQTGPSSYARRRRPEDGDFEPHETTRRQVFDLVRALRPPLPLAQLILSDGTKAPIAKCSLSPSDTLQRIAVKDGDVWVEIVR